jgi:2-polyprenyl-3-methyl-5-hydroxy-6-metoxy-1,4-benzoquinol methylase
MENNKMIEKTTQPSIVKPVKEFWNALLLIIPITFRWFWFLIKNRNLSKEKKSELFWDMGAKNMDRYADNEGLKKINARRKEKLEKYLRGSNRVLDYGCGNGTIAITCAGMVKEIQGIDYAAGMIEAAQRKAAEAKVENARFMPATIFDPRLEKGSCDAVLAWGILHLVDDRNLVVARINELLEPGGLVVSATECMAEKKTPITSLLSFLMKIGIFPISLKFFTVAELEESFTGAGFQIVEKEIMGDNPVSCFIAAKKI